MTGLPRIADPNLLVGMETSDDAAVYQVSDQLAIIQTVDFFPPMVDDPYTFGQVAASNALSDIYAMGGTPKLALNLLCFPSDKLSPQHVRAILEGGADKVAEAGACLCGGHTIEDKEPKYGLSVTGFVHPDRIMANSGAREGDLLILTKALGSGILTTAAKADILPDGAYQALIRTMTSLNAGAQRAMAGLAVHGCTDITGFGLLGHAAEMAQGSNLSLRLMASTLPLLPQARELAQEGIIPAGAYRNREHLEGKVEFHPTVPLDLMDIMFDPQTAGGLLISVAPQDTERLLAALGEQGVQDARLIGEVCQAEDALSLIHI